MSFFFKAVLYYIWMTLMRSDEIGSMRRDLHIDSCRWQSWPGFKLDVFFVPPPPRLIQTGGEKVGLDAGRKTLSNQNHSKQCQKHLQTHKTVGFQAAFRWVL